MAKRKKKRASFGANLKYEVYGILLITISVIAISGEAAVGRSLSKLFGFLFGIHYYLIALAGIWVGLYVMIRRTWPRGWTSRRSGFVLVSLGVALWSAMAAIDNSLGFIDSVSPSSILNQTMNQLKEQLWKVPPAQDVPITEKDIGGGMVGALQYSVLYWLFGYYGAKFVLIIEFAIALLLITNRSYVEMGRSVRLFLLRVMPLLAARLSSGRKLLTAKAIPVKGSGKANKAAAQTVIPAIPAIPDDDGVDEPLLNPRQRKTPLFFQLFHGKPERETNASHEDNWDDEQPIMYAGKQATVPDPSFDRETLARSPVEAAVVEAEIEQPITPRFTDFTAQGYPDEDWDEDAIVEQQVMPLSIESNRESGLDADFDDEDLDLESDQDPIPETAAAIKPKPVRKVPKPYRLPGMNLLEKLTGGNKAGNAADYMSTARKLEATLESFGVRAKVLDVARGPAVTRYELQPDVGVKVSRIVSLTDDIALALAAKDIRMEAPIPGKAAIGIEVPNNEVSVVTLREVLETQPFQESQAKLTIAFGRDISGQPIVGNLARMPHLLVAGATGSGKSVCINGIITSLLYKAKPEEVKFLMIDPKMVELNVYNGIPHLLAPVVTDPRRASLALKKIVVEMEKRYEKFSKSATRNIEGYNALMLSGDNPDAVLPYIVVIVDELADLMMVAAGDVEDAICRLAQMARASGIHLIIATQRPSVDVITGVIKANIPSRIAFGVSSQVDSRTILDMVGAEKLLGRGDMLFLPMGASKPIRVQGAFLSDGEVESVVAYCRGQAEAEYIDDLVPEIDDSANDTSDEKLDELFDQAVHIVLEAKQASVSLLQRRMRIGYTRAARLIDSMEAKGVVGPYEGSKPREVLMTMEQYQQRIPS
ncbi:FtsK/SpoIIIE family DNA translocase [Cohnella silvisoli]|uniref:DNA translocase FtsK n=1 Tax=Cohnella silvisoli TaxID=2873699 RepID=A0ABV1KW57_9BACL|nr:DNA translocase FtsK [Cohnella silvisoli]MCD9023424.1 DNA translocase FtsK [Cohnella silvisoli]